MITSVNRGYTQRRVRQLTHGVKRRLAAACLICLVSLPAMAVEIGGVRVDDKARINDTDVILNGVGLRHKAIFKVYAIGLYLTEKKSTVADVLATTGPRRISMSMLRDLSSDEFGSSFMTGVSRNSTKAEQNRIINQMMRFGEMFALIPSLKKGDLLWIDWVPGVGTVCQLNGKKVGLPVPDVEFYNAILKIWIGNEPIDDGLKSKLLGVPT